MRTVAEADGTPELLPLAIQGKGVQGWGMGIETFVIDPAPKLQEDADPEPVIEPERIPSDMSPADFRVSPGRVGERGVVAGGGCEVDRCLRLQNRTEKAELALASGVGAVERA